VICVNSPDASCTPGQSQPTIAAAVTAAGANALDDTILVGPGTYTGTPITLNAGAHALTLRGAGQGSTTLTMADSASMQTYVNASGANLRDLTILMTSGANSANDTGLVVSNSATVDQVTVTGTGTTNATGVSTTNSQLSHLTIQMPVSSDIRSLYVQGGSTVTDGTFSGGVVQSASAASDTLSRVSIRSDYQGVSTDGGTVNIDDAVIDLGSAGSANGLVAANFNNSTTAKTINANHVTIVGGGLNSKGVWAYAAAPGAVQTATVTLANSIVRGPGKSLVAEASNLVGPTSNATLTVSHTDYQTVTSTVGMNGAGGVVLGAGNVVDVNPAFVNAGGGDYRLAPGSPVIDKGDPASGGPALDRDGTARVVDGDAVPGARRDMGAYELHDSIAPETTIASGPVGITADPTPTFGFTSEAGATFQCKVDAGAFTACTSPVTTPSLADGAHTFAVRATDLASNVDATPATRAFTVDTTAPDTTVTKPAKRTTKRKVKIVFTSEAGATFQCQVDGKAWKACTSPLRLKVKEGKHTVLIRATDAAGNVDATPAKVKFKRVPKQH